MGTLLGFQVDRGSVRALATDHAREMESRIDAAGAVHHIMVKGLEGSLFFAAIPTGAIPWNLLGEILENTRTPCYAWALMPNHGPHRREGEAG